ncbi:pilus assembly protein PilM [Patescibacteria group bacterium]|nr:pilus assembly protein PilM [Patescibacteria group bacterium]
MKFSQIFSSFGSKERGRATRAVGIDIGSSSIKVVELEERENILTLTTYGETQLGPYDAKSVGESVVLDAKKEQQALIDVFRESAVKAERAVLAIPLSASFVTIMNLKSAPDEDLEPRIRIEARKYIPTQISEVTLDWAEVANGGEGTESRDVLLVAIQNDALKRFGTLTEFVGLAQSPSEIECFSTIRALASDGEEHTAIIDVGAISTKLYIIRGGLLQRMHRHRAGGALVTKRIAEVLESSFDQAELHKRTLSSATPKYRDIERAHRSTYERALGEFRHVIDEYEKSAGVKLSRIYLSGGGALFPDFSSEVGESLQKEMILAAPFAKVAYPAFMEDVTRSIGPAFTVALGAALRAYEG